MQPEPSLGGSKYFVSYIDDYSRYCWVYTIKEKSTVLETFRNWLAVVEHQTEQKLQMLRSDSVVQCTSKEMESFLKERAVVHQKTAPYNPPRNRVAERLNRTLPDLIRSMLHQKKPSKRVLVGDTNSCGIHQKWSCFPWNNPCDDPI